ncbi:hypothetical protein GN244_ATG19579 [Phytophthora infestans]|uniref:Uncharacterized protein n=1 Tax=Phytophthora infestans TaxID=4787 RepID=A0A833W4Y2_PHYIN|nr:hypothetical protein GN244_ATG19579 [Phytophthora infestans]
MLEHYLQIEGTAKQPDDIDTIRRVDSERIKTVLPILENVKSIMTGLQKKARLLELYTKLSK